MAQEIINVGTSPNDGQGDPIRDAFIKCNSNFSELYSRVVADVPSSQIGSAGDFAGMYSFDTTYFYVCTAEYDGSSDIWQRIAFDTTPW